MEKTIVNKVASALEAVKSYGQPGFWTLLSILIVLVLVMAVVVYRRIVIKRSQVRSQATQENFETTAADLRKRALEVKKQDEDLRKRELEVKERKHQQVLKRSQRALKGSVSHTMLLPYFKRTTSVVPDSSKADLQRKLDEAATTRPNDSATHSAT
jgi:predicted Holliday junction resolvase-like endonuclease